MAEIDLTRLIDAYLDGGIDAAEMEELASRLRTDTVAARTFALRSAVHRGLRQVHTRSESPAALAATTGATAASARAVLRRVPAGLALSAAAAIALAGAAVGVYLASSTVEPPDERGATYAGEPVGTVTDARGVLFDTEPMDPGDELRPQAIRTRSGDMRFILRSGAAVDLAGPAALRVVDPMAVTVDRGWASFTCPSDAAGFTVTGPSGLRLIDLGTAFEMKVDGADNTEFWVTEGSVEMVTRLGERVTVEAGAGWRHDAASGTAERIDGSAEAGGGLMKRPSALFEHRREAGDAPEPLIGDGSAWETADGLLVLRPAASGATAMSAIGLDASMSADRAWTLETRLRVVEPEGAGSPAVFGIVVRHTDGTTYAAHVRADGLVAQVGFDAPPLPASDLTDRLHTLRLVHPAGADHVIAYIDGRRVPGRIDRDRTGGTPGIFVGDTSRMLIQSGAVELAYLRIDTDGAFAPPYIQPTDPDTSAGGENER